MSIEAYSNYWVVDGEAVPVNNVDGEDLACRRTPNYIESLSPAVLPVGVATPIERKSSPECHEVVDRDACGDIILDYIETYGILMSLQPDSIPDDTSQELWLVANRYDRSAILGRTGLLAVERDGELCLAEEFDGQSYLMELKGVGLPGGGVIEQTDMMGGQVIMGGMTEVEATREAHALLWNSAVGLTRQRLINFGGVALGSHDSYVLFKLTNSTVRLSHYNSEAVEVLDDRARRHDVLGQVVDDMMTRIVNTAQMPCYITTAPHLQNILLEPDGKVSLTDFEDQARLGTSDLPKIHGQTGTLLDSHAIVQEYFGMLKHVRGYEDDDFDHIRATVVGTVVENLSDGTILEGLISDEALCSVQAASCLEELSKAVWMHYVSPLDFYRSVKEGETIDETLLKSANDLQDKIDKFVVDPDAVAMLSDLAEAVEFTHAEAPDLGAAMSMCNQILVKGHDIHNEAIRNVVHSILFSAVALEAGEYNVIGAVSLDTEEVSRVARLIESEVVTATMIARLRTVHNEYLGYTTRTILALEGSAFNLRKDVAMDIAVAEATKLKNDLNEASDNWDIAAILDMTAGLFQSIRNLAAAKSNLDISIPRLEEKELHPGIDSQ